MADQAGTYRLNIFAAPGLRGAVRTAAVIVAGGAAVLGLLLAANQSLAATKHRKPTPAQSAAARSAKAFDPDARLERIFAAISGGHWRDALAETDKLIAEQPNFQLAHLIRGDLLLARTRPIGTLGAGSKANPEQLQDFREEAVARLRGLRQKPAANVVPRYLLQLRPDQKTAVVVDTKRSRLYVYENVDGRPRFLADYYFTQGKLGSAKTREGDLKTPIGVYHITGNLPAARLPDFYGAGALPINYPNEWDQMNGRTGHGIWLHGTPSNTFARAPKASDGCVVLSNRDLISLFKSVKVGVTPVIISDDIEWLSLDDWDKERRALGQAIESWRKDWESLDVPRYLKHYSPAFESNSLNRAQWERRKLELNERKTWIKVQLDKLSMLRYPGKDDLVVVTFVQDYRSNNLSNRIAKRQYWKREGQAWKIIYEGIA